MKIEEQAAIYAQAIMKLEKLCQKLAEERLALLAICQEIAYDSRIDLVDSERRIRLYAAIKKAGGVL